MIVREPGGTIVSVGPILSDEAIVSGGPVVSLIHRFFLKHFHLIGTELLVLSLTLPLSLAKFVYLIVSLSLSLFFLLSYPLLICCGL